MTSFDNGPALASANCWAALVEARKAIAHHRDAIFGADYDYENDPTYKPEAELYRVLPMLETALREAPPNIAVNGLEPRA